MQFCENCGSLLRAGRSHGNCDDCGASFGDSGAEPDGGQSGAESPASGEDHQTELEALPTTSSGSVKKKHAMDWLASRDRPSSAELRRATMEKPSGFTGSTFPTDISTIRLTGDPSFIETAAGLFSWLVDVEDGSRRVELNLKETEDRETGEDTGNYALYLSVAERG